MDFASLMTQQIAKAKGSDAASSDKKAAADTSTAPKKYLSRRELEEQRQAAYLAEQAALEQERAARADAKRKREEEAAEEAQRREDKRRRLAEESRRRREEREAEEERARRRKLGLPEHDDDDDDDHDAAAGAGAGAKNGDGEAENGAGVQDDVPEEELRDKLRALGEPAALFGESHAARLRRYRRLTAPPAQRVGPIATTLVPVAEKDMKVDAVVPKDAAGRKWLYRQLASYFNMVLREWELALAKEDNADTFAGKAAVTAMLQSKETMKPLFRKFEKGDLDDSILGPVVRIVRAAQERRYVDANDGYLELSIGKAAWPIGVTMVGIHERSAREKLHDGERGHVMGDEATRKYLQSIKRCLTFAQIRWPPDDIGQLMG